MREARGMLEIREIRRTRAGRYVSAIAGAVAGMLAFGCESQSPFDDVVARLSADPGTPWSAPQDYRGTAPPLPRPAPGPGGPAVGVEAASGAGGTTGAAGTTGAGGTTSAAGTPEAHSLAMLLDAALANNPSTRMDWERARAASAQLDVANAAYFPTLNAMAAAGGERTFTQALPGPEHVTSADVGGALELTWVLIDFGRRDAASAAAARALAAANYDFNRRLQTVVFQVQQSYFALDSAEARVRAAERDLEAAQMQQRAVEDRLALGLATMPEVLRARRVVAEQQFQVEKARARAYSIHGELASRIGWSPATEFRIQPLAELPLPADMDSGIDALMADALSSRPDVQAAIQRVRQAEERERFARATLLPVIGAAASGGGAYTDYRNVTSTLPAQSHSTWYPVWYAGIYGRWEILDGGARDAEISKAMAERRASVAALRELELKAATEAWTAYFEIRASRLEYDAGVALVKAADDSYAAALEQYQHGLSTIDELLTAAAARSRAHAELVNSRADVLDASVRLAYALGSGPGSQPQLPNVRPRNPGAVQPAAPAAPTAPAAAQPAPAGDALPAAASASAASDSSRASAVR